jgi:hypothetical protein
MSRLIISELEKKAILKRYGVLTEQNVGQPLQPVSTEQPKKAELTITKNVQFPAGYYNQSYLEKSELANEIKKVIDFLSNEQKLKRATYVVNLNIRAGESQIPNTDKENGGERVGVGFLANQRSNTIVKYVNSLLEPYADVLPKGIVPKIEVITGATKFVGQPYCPQKKLPAGDTQGYACLQSNFKPGPNIQNWYYGKNKEYSGDLEQFGKEQFVEVTISVFSVESEITPTTTTTTEQLKPCLLDMQIWINYSDKSKKHTCNSSVYKMFLKGNKGGEILLKRYSKSESGANDGGNVEWASLNNNGDQSKLYLKNGKNKELINYDNNVVDKSGLRYNMFVVPSDIVTKFNGSTEFTLVAQCINPTKFNDSQWKNNCHSDVGNIWIVPGGQMFRKIEYISSTPNKEDSTRDLLTFDECGNQIGDLARLVKGGKVVKPKNTQPKKKEGFIKQIINKIK